MTDAIWKPSQQIQDRVGVGGEDVGEVGAVKDVFEGGQDLHPDMRPVLYRDESIIRLVISLLTSKPTNIRRFRKPSFFCCEHLPTAEKV